MLKVLSVNDEKKITDIIKTAFAVAPWNDEWTEEQLHIYFLDIAANSNSLILGYFWEDEFVGVSLGRLKHWFDGVEYCIDDLCVNPAYQGKGIGSAMLEAITKYAGEHNFKEVSLWTERSSAAYRFYKKNCWEESTEWVQFSMKTAR